MKIVGLDLSGEEGIVKGPDCVRQCGARFSCSNYIYQQSVSSRQCQCVSC